MQESTTQGIVIFIIGISFLLALLIGFIVSIIYKYQQKQNAYFKDIETLKAIHENTLLQSQLEIQEQTFQNISREIHDNIGQKLTLAKLHLNTLNPADAITTTQQVADAVNIIGEAINDLSDLSRSMSSEILLDNGLIKALEFEAAQLKKSGQYSIIVSTGGNPVFLDSNTELVLFRIAQEAINNIVKHADASAIDIRLHYSDVFLTMAITDNGKGFCTDEKHFGTGLQNMKNRSAMLKGSLQVSSEPQTRTTIKLEIPIA